MNHIVSFDRECWYDDNELYHREDGPAYITKRGLQEWYIHGKRHRLDGPAIIFINGDRSYYINDNISRLDGPAIEWENNTQWYIDGERIDCHSNEEFLRIVKIRSLL
jgi:hypothetical protein